MAAMRVVNLRVSYQVDVHKRESEEFYTRHQDAPDDRATVRAEIEVLRRERLAYEREYSETRQAFAILYRVDSGDFYKICDDLRFIVINNPFWK
ncbi:hypothetical protein Tco_0918649, partial [Tanacetum coccineum]